MADITKSMYKCALEQAMICYDNNTPKQSAIENVMSLSGMTVGSADYYVSAFLHQINGRVYKREISIKATDYYLKNILKNYGKAGLNSALKSLMLHIEYRKLEKKTNSPGLRQVYNKFNEIKEYISTLSNSEFTVEQIVSSIIKTTKYSNGQEIKTTKKNKKLNMSDDQLKLYIIKLMEKQKHICALTGLEMSFHENPKIKHIWYSPDRIDSSKHYEKGNIQLVCRFANRWKSNSSDTEFKKLLSLIRSV